MNRIIFIIALAVIDTLMLDFATQAVPGMQFGKASAITGNFGAEGLDMIYFVRPVMSEFFFRDALYPYLPDADSQSPFIYITGKNTFQTVLCLFPAATGAVAKQSHGPASIIKDLAVSIREIRMPTRQWWSAGLCR